MGILPILFVADVLVGSISISPWVFIEALSGNAVERGRRNHHI